RRPLRPAPVSADLHRAQLHHQGECGQDRTVVQEHRDPVVPGWLPTMTSAGTMTITLAGTARVEAAAGLRLSLSGLDVVLIVIYFAFVLGIGLALRRVIAFATPRRDEPRARAPSAIATHIRGVTAAADVYEVE